MQKNKVTTYLLYAIGEVILVVFGILIAIQLDTLNNQKLRAKENKKLLLNLVQDLERDLDRIHFLSEEDGEFLSIKTAAANSSKALEISYRPLTIEMADSLISIKFSSGNPVLNGETNVYDQLKSTGRLYSIGSDSLRSKIIAYYTRAFRETAYINRFNQIMMSDIQENVAYRQLRMDKQHDANYSIEKYPWLFDRDSEEMKKYRLMARRAASLQKVIYDHLSVLKKDAEELIRIINEEVPDES